MGLFPKASHSPAHPWAAPAAPALQDSDLLPLAPSILARQVSFGRALFCTAGCCGARQRTHLDFRPAVVQTAS
jgi:hypothetical protein